MVLMRPPRTVFVPNGNNRRATAVLLVGTAREFGIDQHDIQTAPSGFFITDRLADVLYDEGVYDEGDSSTETSGNRAEKTDSQEGE